MRRRHWLPGLGLGLVALVGACAPPPPQVVYVQQPAATCNTAFRLVNNSSVTVERFYFSHSSQGAWGPDQLGTSVLPPGRTINYRAANTGNYDFRVVWTDGRAAELRQVNVCVASQITVTNRGLYAS